MAKAPLTRPQAETYFKEAVDDLLPFIGGEFPNLSNHTPGRLVDIVGNWKVLEAELKKHINLLNGIIDTKLDDPDSLKEGEEPPKTAQGDIYVMTITSVTQQRLDTDTARAELFRLGGQESVAKATKPLVMDQHRYSKK